MVDDGSSDLTTTRLKQWENRVTVLYKEKNEGKGSALTVGFKKTKGDCVLIQDADLEYSPIGLRSSYGAI